MVVMLTILVIIFAIVILTHLLADVLKAGVVVALVLGIIYLSHGVTFQALVDDGARALYDDAGDTHCAVRHRGERI